MTKEKKHITGTFRAKDGTELFYRRSRAQSNKRVLFFHGLFEHSEDYADIADRIFPEGNVEWAALDIRGHGYSGGKRNEIDPEKIINDYEYFLTYLGWSEGSFAVVAQSFGGLLALMILKKKLKLFKALLLSAPFLGMPEDRSHLVQLILLIISYIYPNKKITKPLQYSFLCHDKNKVKAYLDDPLRSYSMTLGLFRKIRKIQKSVMNQIVINCPLCVLIAGDERIVNKGAIYKWFEKCKAKEKTKKEFESLYHEVFNEPDNQNVIEEARSFLERYL